MYFGTGKSLLSEGSTEMNQTVVYRYSLHTGIVLIVNALIVITSVQCNLSKDGIADFSPLIAANGFVPSGPPTSNTWFLGLTRVSPPNSISIGSALFAQYVLVTNVKTHRPCYV